MAPRKANKSKPRRRMARRAPRKGVAAKSKNNVSDFAGLSCTRTLSGNVANQMYKFNTFTLADFPRAVQVAKAYQHYRISGIKLTYKPNYDVYSQALAGGGAKPFLYYMIDKSDGIPTTATLESLKQMGARPHNFDEKPRTITWRPSVLTEEQNTIAGSTAAAYKVSPWLATNSNPGAPGVWTPSTIAHKGLTWYMEQPGATFALNIEVEIQFQFKKPLFDMTPSPTHAKPLQYAIIDASPDGVEGGTDGITIPVTS